MANIENFRKYPILLICDAFFSPYLFPKTISNKIKELAKDRINGELNFSKAGFSFFSHFPSLTLDLHGLLLKGSAPFTTLTLGVQYKFHFNT